ncbi:citrate lyase acyl carrier protein [Treponema primitia ZAS-2]|uniref:Citrate lyase acyl carrier protein n=1 Tax=Treponema primitia (strain ATCC BAA-887 / DSM 12427 / ZAS-2) TaxID=545694 RepID=F5YRE7_TREPZ|nr:citrate lyase acyl carrier protein [Treponema primitia]AEF86858.1 citrate lyase acyl carrier protein [Treponema primitia ZAS-2]
MQVIKNAVSGTLESSDIYIEVLPGKGVEIDLSSPVIRQFGESIKKTMLGVVRGLGIEDVHIRAHDQGAMDCVIQARLETALLRAGEEN